MKGVFDNLKKYCICKCDWCCCRHPLPQRCISYTTQRKICLQSHEFYPIPIILFSFVSYNQLHQRETWGWPPSGIQFYHLIFLFHLQCLRTTSLSFIFSLQKLIYAMILYFLIEPLSLLLIRSQTCPCAPIFYSCTLPPTHQLCLRAYPCASVNAFHLQSSHFHGQRILHRSRPRPQFFHQYHLSQITCCQFIYPFQIVFQGH